MRIALITFSLEGGGAARVMVNMANYWAAAGHDVMLVSFEDGSSPSFYPVSDQVKVVYLGLNKFSHNLVESLANNWRRTIAIRKTVQGHKSDVVVSFIDTANVRTILALAGTGIPLVVSERIHPAYEKIGRIWDLARLITYPFADSLVVQTSPAASFFKNKFIRRLRIVANPVLPVPSDESIARESLLIAVGRLYPQKGYELLLNAFSRIADKHETWTLCIAGEGPLRKTLEKQIGDLGLSERVCLLGQVSDIPALLNRAGAYVMSSNYEGFPNALCEAMAAGLPCVSTNCPSGPSDIIVNGKNGLLCANENEEALAEALDQILGDSALRERLGKGAADIVRRFGIENVMKQWEECLHEVVEGRRSRWKMKVKSFLTIPLELVQWIVRTIPSRLGVFLRRSIYAGVMREGRMFDIEPDVVIKGLGNLALGSGTCIERGCTLLCPGASMTIGGDSYLNINVRLGSNGHAPLTIGDNVMVGPNVVMDTSRHNDDRTDIPMKQQGLSYAPIVIEDDVWVGANAVITSGVTVGTGSIVAAGAVVTTDIEPYCVVGGVPAKLIRTRTGKGR